MSIPKTTLLCLLALATPACAQRNLDVVVLYSTHSPQLRTRLPADRCTYVPIEGFRPTGAHAATVVVAGHSLPPVYLDRPADEVARAIASYTPDLVVFDTCYGASMPILDALAAEGQLPWVVAPPYRLPDEGFAYAPGFVQTADPARRARLVRTEPPYPLLRVKLAPTSLAAVHATTDAMDAKQLRAHLKTVQPALVRVPMPGMLEPQASVLVLVPPQRFHVATMATPPGAAPGKATAGSPAP